MPSTKKELTDEERGRVVFGVLTLSDHGTPARGVLTFVADEFGVDPSTVSRIWERARKAFDCTGEFSAKSLKHMRGRHARDDSAALERLRGADLSRRSTIRSSSAVCGVPRSTLHRRTKEGALDVHTSVVKPLLTEANMATRLAWCAAHVNEQSLLFDDIMGTIHVDEKLFYLAEVKRRFYLLPGEEPPKRHVKSKRFIGKVMFFAAVARPRRDLATGMPFDGKLGIWAFVEKRAALRSSTRRPAGTIETKSINVTKATYRKMLIEKLLPAISNRWSLLEDDDTTIKVQQDNASPHIPVDDPHFRSAVAQHRHRVELAFQPPNSPDLNILDLGLFTAIQARQRQRVTRDLDELIAAVEASYWDLPPDTINACFLTLQSTMDKCIQEYGGNAFKPAHMGKARLEKEGRLPLSLRCSDRATEVLSIS